MTKAKGQTLLSQRSARITLCSDLLFNFTNAKLLARVRSSNQDHRGHRETATSYRSCRHRSSTCARICWSWAPGFAGRVA